MGCQCNLKNEHFMSIIVVIFQKGVHGLMGGGHGHQLWVWGCGVWTKGRRSEVGCELWP